MGDYSHPAWAKGTVGLLAARQRGEVDRQFQTRLTVTRSMIDRLGLEYELNGHIGCVNCLEWNSDGSILASASDDLRVILWDPFKYKKLNTIITGHTGNIFSVKFLSEDVLATCAADGTVRVRNLTSGASLRECTCHCGRIKRLATAPYNPHLIWSAGEDGFIIQHDLRTAHRCNSETPNVLVSLNQTGRFAEAKCAAVNPRRPHQLAVGANDFYVRLYDMRMIKLTKLQVPAEGSSEQVNAVTSRLWERQNVRCARVGLGDPDNNIPRAAVQYYAPGHLSMEPNEHTFPKKAATYVAFSHDGNELLVNMGSEQIYLFDINSGRQPVLVESFIIQHNHGCRDDKPRNGTTAGANGTTAGSNGSNGINPGPPMDAPVLLPDHVRELKEMANDLVNKGSFSGAVELYNRAIGSCPDCAILYSNRAAALMRRGWVGDTYAAIRDCYSAIKLDPQHVKSHFRLAKGLMDLKRAREAHEALVYFKHKFPRHASSHAVFLLQKDISGAMDGMESQPDEAHYEGDSRAAPSAAERAARGAALDYSARFLGHCNTTTDIKEANFLGPDANYIAAGSDDGSLFVWCRRSGNIVRILRGDESIVNCVQLHPSTFLLATSGIETLVRLWSPRPEDGKKEPRVISDASEAARANQQRMRSDPFEAMLVNISFAERDLHPPACRPT